MAKLVTKSQLAKLAGVAQSAISVIIKRRLKPAMVGKRIDVNHPLVVKYINDRPSKTKGKTDFLYQDAVELCRSKNKFTISLISRKLSIGYARADRIFAMMHALGTDVMPPPEPEPETPPPPPTPIVKVEPEISTHTLAKTKKQRALNEINSKDNPLETGTIIHEIPEDIRSFIDMTLRELIQRFGTDIAFLDWLKATKAIEEINEKRLRNAVTQGELVSRHLIKIGVIDQINTTHKKLLTDCSKTINKRVRAMTKSGRSENETEKFIVDQISSFIRPMKVKMVKALRVA